MTHLSHFIFLVLLACAFGDDKISNPTRTTPAAPKVDICQLPVEPGPCRMVLERYYYNPQTNSCEKFKFGGCRGNANKFGFLKTCEEACVRSSTSTTTAIPRSAATVRPAEPVQAGAKIALTSPTPAASNSRRTA